MAGPNALRNRERRLSMAVTAAANTEQGPTVKVSEPVDIVGSLPFETIYGGNVCFFGQERDGQFSLDKAHFDLFGLGYGGHKLTMEFGRRTNGTDTRFTGDEVIAIMEALGLRMNLPATVRPCAGKYGPYLSIPYVPK